MGADGVYDLDLAKLLSPSLRVSKKNLISHVLERKINHQDDKTAFHSKDNDYEGL